jgi:hypothetical protein
VQSADNTIGIKPPDLVFSEQKHMAGSGEFPSNFVTPSIVDNTIAVQPVVSIRCYMFVAILVVSLLES